LEFTVFVCEHNVTEERRKLLRGDFHNLYSPNNAVADNIIKNKTAVTLKYIFGTRRMNLKTMGVYFKSKKWRP
jgi:hypothetical protein